MSRTVRRVNKYISYCTLYNVKRCNSELQIALMDPHRYRYQMSYLGFDEEYAARFYRDGYHDSFLSSRSFRKNPIYNARVKAYYKRALVKCMKSEDLEFEAINIRKVIGGFADWW